MTSRQTVAILDFGSQYSQLIARRVREQKVYSKLYPGDIAAGRLAQLPLKGIILSGGMASVRPAGFHLKPVIEIANPTNRPTAVVAAVHRAQ